MAARARCPLVRRRILRLPIRPSTGTDRWEFAWCYEGDRVHSGGAFPAHGIGEASPHAVAAEGRIPPAPSRVAGSGGGAGARTTAGFLTLAAGGMAPRVCAAPHDRAGALNTLGACGLAIERVN